MSRDSTRDLCLVCYALENSLHHPESETVQARQTAARETRGSALTGSSGIFNDQTQRKRFDRQFTKAARKTREFSKTKSEERKSVVTAQASIKLMNAIKSTLQAIRRARMQRKMQQFMLDFVGDRRGIVHQAGHFQGLGAPEFVKEIPESTRQAIAFWETHKMYWNRVPSLCGRDFRHYRAMTASKYEKAVKHDQENITVEDALLPEALIQRPCSPGHLYASAGRVRYFESCSHMHRAPRLPPFLLAEPEQSRDQSSGVQFEKFTLNKGFGHPDHLCAATDALLASGRAVQEVNLAGGGFSSPAMHTLLQGLVLMGPSRVQLQTLVLSGNRLSEAGMATLDEILNCNLGRNLTRLDLSDLPVPPGSWTSLALRIGKHPNLQKLSIARTGLGRVLQAHCVAVAEAVATCPRLEELDIGGNFVGHEGAAAFASAIGEADLLKMLDFSWNAGGFDLTKKEKFCPIHSVLESLAHSPNLIDARFADCMLDSDADLVLEDAMATREKLEDLDLSGNPHGVEGLRCLLRIVARSNTLNIKLHGLREGGVAGSGRYDYQNPNGHHKFDFTFPAHRALFRLLWRRAQGQCKVAGNSSPTDAFRDIRFDGKPLSKDKGLSSVGIEMQSDRWGDRLVVPTSGHLECMIHMPQQQNLTFGSDPAVVLRRHFQAQRIQFSFRRYVAVSFMYKSLQYEHLQKILAYAAQKDLHLKFAHMRDLIEASPSGFGSFVAQALLPNVDSSETRWHHGILCMGLKEHEVEQIARQSRSLIWFNERCLEQRYNLDLGVLHDYEVAKRLFIIDKWMQAAAEEADVVDLSQKGDRSGIRNSLFRNRPLYKGWELPPFVGEHVPFQFDYAYGSRIPSKSLGKESEDQVIESIIDLLGEVNLPSISRRRALQSIAHELNLNANQLAAITISFSGGSECPHSRPPTPQNVDIPQVGFNSRKAFVPEAAEHTEDRAKQHRAGVVVEKVESNRERTESSESNRERTESSQSTQRNRERTESSQSNRERTESSQSTQKKDIEDEKPEESVPGAVDKIGEDDNDEKEKVATPFDPQTDRVLVLHMLFSRCREQHRAMSQASLYDGDLLSKEEGVALRERLGPLRTLEVPRCHCKKTLMGNAYKFDLSLYEWRVMAKVFLTVSTKEASSEMSHCNWTCWAPALTGDFFVIPSDWMREVPHEGELTFEYHHYLKGSVNSATRLEMAQKCFGWFEDWEFPDIEEDDAEKAEDAAEEAEDDANTEVAPFKPGAP